MVGQALVPTKADVGGRERARGSERERARERESETNGWGGYDLATQKATTKLVPSLINNTRLQKSFENLENLKLEPYGGHKAYKMEYFRDSDSLRLLRHIHLRANESITQMKECLLCLQDGRFVGKGTLCVTPCSLFTSAHHPSAWLLYPFPA